MAFFYQSIQGNMGLGKAIQYFTSQGISVSIPLNDTQPYDLIADFEGKLQRISVKTSRYKKSENSYSVQLRNTGGEDKTRKKNFDNTTCDYLFIYTANEKIYLIPAKNITVTNSIAVGNKYCEYEVKIKTLADLSEEEILINSK